MRPIRPLFAALAVAVLCGCGTANAAYETPEHATAEVRQAYLKTVDAGSATVAISAEMTATVNGRSEQGNLHGSGVFDFAGKRSQVTVTTPLGIEVEMRTIGVDFYEKAPAQLRRRFPGSRPWMRVDFDAADRAQYGGPLYVFRPSGGDDPWQMLGVLPAASSVRHVGTESISGTRARHYRATLRLADVATLGGDQTGPGRREFQRRMGMDTVPLEIWLDDQGRLLRLQAQVPMQLTGATWTSAGGVVNATATAVLEFSDFGRAVEVSAPAADETDDLTPLVAERGIAAVGEIVGLI